MNVEAETGLSIGYQRWAWPHVSGRPTQSQHLAISKMTDEQDRQANPSRLQVSDGNRRGARGWQGPSRILMEVRIGSVWGAGVVEIVGSIKVKVVDGSAKAGAWARHRQQVWATRLGVEVSSMS